MIKTEGTTIKVFRGDSGHIHISKTNSEGDIEQFNQGDKVILTVKNNFGEEQVLLRKEVVVSTNLDKVQIDFSSEDTKFVDLISEPVDYEYDVKVNDCHTIIGHDDSGSKIFRVYPSGSDVS